MNLDDDILDAVRNSDLTTLIAINQISNSAMLRDRTKVAALVHVAIHAFNIEALIWLQQQGLNFTNLLVNNEEPILVTACKAFSSNYRYADVFSFIANQCRSEVNRPCNKTGLTPLGALIRYGSYPECSAQIDTLFSLHADEQTLGKLNLSALNKYENEFIIYAKIVCNVLDAKYTSSAPIRSRKIRAIAESLPNHFDPLTTELDHKIYLLSMLSPFFSSTDQFIIDLTSRHIKPLCDNIIESIDPNVILAPSFSLQKLTELFNYFHKSTSPSNYAYLVTIVCRRSTGDRLNFLLNAQVNKTEVESLLLLVPINEYFNLSGTGLGHLYQLMFFLNKNNECESIVKIVQESPLVLGEEFMQQIKHPPIERFSNEHLLPRYLAETNIIIGEIQTQIVEEQSPSYQQPTLTFSSKRSKPDSSLPTSESMSGYENDDESDDDSEIDKEVYDSFLRMST